MEIEHFTHIHPLTLNEDHDYEACCAWCKKPISRPSYSCRQCDLFLHKACAELPRKIKHHFHRQHPLLLSKPSQFSNLGMFEYGARMVCHLCLEICFAQFFCCHDCDFCLHIGCASLPNCLKQPETKSHVFTRLVRSVKCTCDECGENENFSPKFCLMCKFMVHEECVSIKKTIKVIPHNHTLTLSFYFQQFDSTEPLCGICNSRVDTNFRVYFCLGCNYFVHVKCARKFATRRSFLGEREDETPPHEEINNGENNVIVEEIKHFSHPHNLTLMSNEIEKHCDGCMLPILSSFYSCTQCNFFLHKTCIELPEKRSHDCGQLYWSLLPEAPTFDNIFRCSECNQFSHGFAYNLTGDIYCDARCKSPSESYTHEGHEHVLVRYFRPYGEQYYCSASSKCEVSYPPEYKCLDCEFRLCRKCAALPRKWKHEYDPHMLSLTYNSPHDSNGYYCIICEKERDPKDWFYSCAECDFAAHPKCVLGKNPFVKLGGTFVHDIHSHPLTLTQKTGHFPPCNTCGLPCDDLALECTLSDCDFIVHRKNVKCLQLSQ